MVLMLMMMIRITIMSGSKMMVERGRRLGSRKKSSSKIKQKSNPIVRVKERLS